MTFAQATPREIRWAAAVARGGAVPSSLAWADPRFALQTRARLADRKGEAP